MMGNPLELVISAIQRLLQRLLQARSSDSMLGNSYLYSLMFLQLQRSQQLLKLLPKEPILDWHGLIYEELYRVVTRISTLVEYSEDIEQGFGSHLPFKKGRNYSSSGDISMIPAEARAEHFLETLLDLRWWTWVVAFQAGMFLDYPALYNDCFGAFEGVLEAKSSTLVVDRDSITRRLPSYSFELWQQAETEGRLKEILQFQSKGKTMSDQGEHETNMLLTKIRKAELPVFIIKGLSPRSTIQDPKKPSSIQDYLEIDLTQDLLGASSTGYVIRTTCSDGQGGFCALKKINTLDAKPPDIARLRHPHVVHLKHYWREECDLRDEVAGSKSRFMTFLVMELMDGDLAKLMKRTKKVGVAPFSLPVAVDVMLQIAKGMLYSHEMGFSHPHLKCENVLCRVGNKIEAFTVGDVLIKLGGFGCSRPANVVTKNRDVFCFGLTCLEILTGDEWSEDIYGADRVPRPTIPETTPPILNHCIASCLDPELTGSNLIETKLTFSKVVMLLLMAQLQIMQKYKDEMVFSNESLHTENAQSKNQDLAPSVSRSNDGLQEMFHVHQLHPQLGEVQTSVQITLIFFHGFPKVSEEWRVTWMTRDNKLLWPQKWLPEDLVGANIRVLSVSFDDYLDLDNGRIQPEMSKYLLQKVVLDDTWKLGETEQVIVLVGHSLGGLLIKSLVNEAETIARRGVIRTSKVAIDFLEISKCKTFLESLASVVFYSVPHSLTSTEFENYITGCNNTRVLQRSSLLKSLRGNDCFIPEMMRLSKDFEIALPHKTKVLSFLEGKPMSKKYFLVTEKSCVLGWEWHKIDKDNHFEVCRPDSKSHTGYKILLCHIKQHMLTPYDLTCPTTGAHALKPVLKINCRLESVPDATFALQKIPLWESIWMENSLDTDTESGPVDNTSGQVFQPLKGLMPVLSQLDALAAREPPYQQQQAGACLINSTAAASEWSRGASGTSASAAASVNTRLQWTPILHEKFESAVTQLRGPEQSWKEQTMDSSGKYVRYTNEQVEALERVYHECPKPSSIRRHQLIKESPILSNIEPKQIKVWFQNRRCREKQRKEATQLVSVNAKLTALNKLLMEENERLAKHSSQLALENQALRQQQALADGVLMALSGEVLQNPLKKEGAVNGGDERSTQGGSCVKLHWQAGVASTDTSCDSAVTGVLPHRATPQHSPRDTSPAGISVTAHCELH